jgi:ketosteroid isomerase-like protein
MTDHPNAVNARKALEAFNAGDMPAMLDLLDETIVWHAPGTSRFAGRFEGKDAVLDRFRRMGEAGVRTTFDIHDVIGNDDHVVALVQVSVTDAGGRHYDGPQVQVMHVRDAKAFEFWGMNQDQAAMDVVLGA